MNSMPMKMESIILIVILLGWSGLNALPLDISTLNTTILVTKDYQADNGYFISNAKTFSEEIGMHKSKSVLQKPQNFKLVRPVVGSVTSDHQVSRSLEKGAAEDTKSSLSNISLISKLQKSTTETTVFDSSSATNVNEDEPRPVTIGPRLTATLLKVLTILG